MHQHKPHDGCNHPTPALSVLAHTRVADSIAEIGSTAWNACFPAELEDYHYLLAVEKSAIPGFTRRYAVVEEHGIVVAAMPAFFCDYQIDTTLEDGAPRRAIRRLRSIFPRFLTIKLACLGSPEIECAKIGFHPTIAESAKPALLAQLVSGFEYDARRRGFKLIGVKDLPAPQKPLWDTLPGFASLPAMPTARLSVDFASAEEYLARLSHKSRKDMRRKLKDSAIRIEQRDNVDDVLPQIIALYRSTRQRSEFQFEELNQAYFQGVLAHMSGRAFCTLFWHGQTLLAANLMLADKHLLLDKFFCMDAGEGRKHNLYYVSWFANIAYCLEHHIPCYQCGQAGYENKLRLKSQLTPNWLMFRHANPVMAMLLKLTAHVLAMSEDNHEH